MKIIIYGGSFDPVHKGHHALLKAAFAQIKPDYAHIFTAWQSPFKSKSPVTFEMRQNMAQQALGQISPNIIFDDFERRKKRMVYTWETIKYIRALYPGAQVYLLVGTDCLNSLHKWKNAAYIFENSIILAGARKGFNFGDLTFKFEVLKGSFPLISSTQIRLAILCNGLLPTVIMPQTSAFIEKNNMYGLHIHKWLEANLRPKRYLHTKLVAQAAVTLAAKYRADTYKAALAGILHDMAKCMSDEDLMKYCAKNKIVLKNHADICKYSPSLLHAAVSADMAGALFGITDKEILRAIERHTLGAADMGTLDKVVFIADMASKDRKYCEAKAVQSAAQKSLDNGLIAAMAIKLVYTIQTQKWIAPVAPELWNKLISKLNSKDA